MQFRRLQRVRVLPVVALVTIGISAFSLLTSNNAGGIVALCAIFLFYWSVMALVNWLRKIVIDTESIRLFGYLGGPVVIQKSDVATCRYRRFRPNAHGSPDVAFLVIRDDRGNEIPVWRHGWGPRRRDLFARLGQWLDDSRCSVDDQAREVLMKVRAIS